MDPRDPLTVEQTTNQKHSNVKFITVFTRSSKNMQKEYDFDMKNRHKVDPFELIQGSLENFTYLLSNQWKLFSNCCMH